MFTRFLEGNDIKEICSDSARNVYVAIVMISGKIADEIVEENVIPWKECLRHGMKEEFSVGGSAHNE